MESNRPTDIERPAVAQIGTSSIAVLTVTFHPNLARLSRQMQALPLDSWLVLVDNASTPSEVDALRHLAQGRDNTRLFLNSSNVGLAAALNQAANHAQGIAPQCEFLLLMDQDSEPHAGAVASLLQSMCALESLGRPVGCVGPMLIDDNTGLQHGFHCITGWRWARVFPKAGASSVVECANLNGSGTLMRVSLFQRMKGMDEAMFIDHVDTEWSFRVVSAGLKLFGIPNAIFGHGMGVRGFRVWLFGWRVWPYRSPQRHYYLFRNAIRLMRRDYVPVVWKSWAIAKLGLTCFTHLVFDRQRFHQVDAMLRGAWSGCKGNQSWRTQ